MKKNLNLGRILNRMFFVAIGMVSFGSAKAQLNPLGASFYQNQYLSNPAFVGMDRDFKLNLHYRNQWSAIPGAPVNYALTGEYQLTDNKSGLGINAYIDRSGILKRTRAVASYAYHLPLNADGDKLHFGVSLGFMSNRVESDAVNGDVGDATIGIFNNKPNYVDGDFGIGYTTKQLTVQVAVPNLNAFFSRSTADNVDMGTYYAAIGYRIYKNGDANGYNVEPKVAYRAIRGYKDILDIGLGANLGLNSSNVNAMLVYHSSKSMTMGIGMLMKSKLEIQAIYNSDTAALSSYTNGTFELGLGLRLK